jgi:hypothetical protein
MTIKMEALARQNYGGKWYSTGETIPVNTELDASDLIAMCLAKRIPAKVVPIEPATTIDRSLEAAGDDEAKGADAAPVPKDAAATVPEKKNKRYDHREMRSKQR